MNCILKVILVSILIFTSQSQLGFTFQKRVIGTPLTKASCDVQGCKHEQLVASRSSQFESVITRAGKDYIWTSREGVALSKSSSGAFDLFKGPGTSGYIKITNQSDQCLYMEHLQLAFQTITYWGVCEEQ